MTIRRLTPPGWLKDAWIFDALTRGPYRVRLDGSIYKMLPKGKIQEIKPSLHKRAQRFVVTITHDGITKSVLVNRLVALALIPNPFNLPEVNHKNGNKQDDHPDNLEWSDRSDQEKHAFANGLKANRGSANANAKLNPAVVQMIRESKLSDADLARECKVSVGAIRNAREGRSWSHL